MAGHKYHGQIGKLNVPMRHAGHRRKHHTSAVAAATARRDELQQLLDHEKERFIDDQAVLAQQPDVSYSSRPAAHEVRNHIGSSIHWSQQQASMHIWHCIPTSFMPVCLEVASTVGRVCWQSQNKIFAILHFI